VTDLPLFEPTRLTVARQRNRMTKAKLAEGIGVSLRMISLYESGRKSPSHETLARIATVLGFPVEFFGREAPDLFSAEAASFRSLAKRTGRERDAALAAGVLADDLSSWIASQYGLPVPKVPDLRGIDPETAASLLRREWGLEGKPIANTIRRLEYLGVRVFSLSESGTAIDAFSLWRDDIPFVFLNTQKTTEHSRHDAMHELGHLVLHKHGAPQGQRAEREADAFASAILLPKEHIISESVEYPTLDDLIPKKRRWKVSLASYVYRLHRLNKITDWHYHLLFKEMTQRGYRVGEPDGLPREGSQVLEKVFAHLRKKGISKRNVADKLCIPFAELEKLIFGLVVSAVRGGNSDTPQFSQVVDRKLAIVQ
jgi:Zn-dependent peptidase ImmA (M78 family)/DNA-binding XRE family transcriptional regulator